MGRQGRRHTKQHVLEALPRKYSGLASSRLCIIAQSKYSFHMHDAWQTTNFSGNHTESCTSSLLYLDLAACVTQTFESFSPASFFIRIKMPQIASNHPPTHKQTRLKIVAKKYRTIRHKTSDMSGTPARGGGASSLPAGARTLN